MSGHRQVPEALRLGKSRYPLYGRLGGHQGRSGRARNTSPQPGFDPRTVQPVASRYADKLNPLILWPRLCLLYHHQMMMMIKAIMMHGYEAPLK
jgi:hypothetical protein